MEKDTFYFSHDYNSRSDGKIKKLLSKHGYNGYGIFWAIIEDLYNNANALRMDYDSIAFDLRSNSDVVKSIIHDFDLFVFDGDFFGSLSVERRILERNKKSQKARESALSRWNKKNEDANALPTQSDCNAIKERKGKENKGNEIKKINRDSVFNFDFVGENFKQSFFKYLDYRKKMKKEFKTQMSLEACYKNLLELSKRNWTLAEQIVKQSIENQWLGLFEIKEKNSAKKENETGTNKAESAINAANELINKRGIDLNRFVQGSDEG